MHWAITYPLCLLENNTLGALELPFRPQVGLQHSLARFTAGVRDAARGLSGLPAVRAGDLRLGAPRPGVPRTRADRLRDAGAGRLKIQDLLQIHALITVPSWEPC